MQQMLISSLLQPLSIITVQLKVRSLISTITKGPLVGHCNLPSFSICFRIRILSPTWYSWEILCLFSCFLVSFVTSCFQCSVAAQFAKIVVGIIMSQPNTSCEGDALRVVWSVCTYHALYCMKFCSMQNLVAVDSMIEFQVQSMLAITWFMRSIIA